LGGATATFQISGPYALIKRFVYEVEHFPRFLIVEKVDFVDIQRQSGALKLKITLAGYFENDNEE
jgi:Tfp pilus assembly protein PilO